MDSETTIRVESDERLAVRPSLPPLAWMTLAVWMGLRLGEQLSWGDERAIWGLTGSLALVAVCFLGLLGYAFLTGLRTSKSRSPEGRGVRVTSWLLAISLACGVFVGVVAWDSHDAGVEVLSDRSATEWRLATVADGRDTGFGFLVEARVLDGEGQGATVSVMLPTNVERPPLSGETIVVQGTFASSEGEYERNDRRKRVSGSVRAWSVRSGGRAPGVSGSLLSVRTRLLETLEGVEGDGGALLAAMLAGFRGRVAGTLVESDFRAAGLSHVLAVSGTHLAVIAWASGAIASLLGAGRRGRWATIVCAALLFTLFTGAHASTVRASIMVLATCAAALMGRRHDALGALSATVLGMLLFAPELAFSVGLSLSASAVAGLVIFSPLAQEWLKAALPARGRKVASAASVALVAHAATIPIVATTFGTVATMGPGSNIVCVPLVTLALWLGCVGAVLGVAIEPIGALVLGLAGDVLEVCAALAHKVAVTPGAVLSTAENGRLIAVGAVAAMALAWIRWPHPMPIRVLRGGFAFAMTLALLPVVAPTMPASARLVVLDVGQGDAILIQDGAACLLVDAGEEPEVLRGALGRFGVRHVDAVILTHAHEDHTGGLAGLRGTCSVDSIHAPEASLEDFAPLTVLASELTGAAAVEGAVHGLKTGDRFSIGRFDVEVLWPDSDTWVDDTNDGSVVLHVSAEGFSALLTGDAESGVYERIAAAGQLPQIDMLKVPHHGSEDGVSVQTLAEMRPRIALISVGAGNDFEHPAASTLRMFGEAGIRTWRTDQSGDLTVDVTDQGFGVSVAR